MLAVYKILIHARVTMLTAVPYIYIYVIKKERKKTMFWLVVAKHNAFDI